MTVQRKQSPGMNTALKAFTNLTNDEKKAMLRKLKLNNSKTSGKGFIEEMQKMSKNDMRLLFEELFKLTKK